MNVRAQATGMASQMQNIANSIVQQFFPIFLKREGFACFYMFFAINILLAVFVWFVVPETKGIPLEEMDVLFGGANHADRGAGMVDKKRPSRASGDGRNATNSGELGIADELNVLPNK
jgi:hypothetical protein